MEAPEVQQDEELRATGTKEFSWAKEQLERTVKRAFQHACYLAQPDPEGDRYLDQISFDDERASGLDGTIVWKAMAERDKAFDAGEFGAEALVHNLRDADYGRTLSELCAAFYQAPRLPLLFSGDGDLRQAVYDAVLAGTLEIVDGKGETVAVTAPNEVNLASAGLRLAKPRARPPGTDQAASGRHDAGSEEGGAVAAGESTGGADDAPTAKERNVSLAFNGNLLASPADSDGYARLFRSLYAALDERKVSYLQGTLQIILDAGDAEELREHLEELGIRGTFRDQ